MSEWIGVQDVGASGTIFEVDFFLQRTAAFLITARSRQPLRTYDRQF